MQQVNLPKITTTDDPQNGLSSFGVPNQPKNVVPITNSANDSYVNAVVSNDYSTPTPAYATTPQQINQMPVQAQPAAVAPTQPVSEPMMMNSMQNPAQSPMANQMPASVDEDKDDDDSTDSAWNDPWASAWDDPWGAKKDKKETKKLSPQERTDLIQRLYKDVLGREADTRDINYYKYSTLDEEEMRNQLLTGKEHKQLIEDGREFKQLKTRVDQSETRVKMLEAQVRDQVAEFKQLNELLQEKNRYISQLRTQVNNPYNFTSDPAAFEKQLNYTHHSQSTHVNSSAGAVIANSNNHVGSSTTTQSTQTHSVPQTEPMIHHESVPAPSTTPINTNPVKQIATFNGVESADEKPVKTFTSPVRTVLDKVSKSIRNLLDV